MLAATAKVPTANGGKYVQQLCKHWAHKLDVVLDGDEGRVTFDDAVAHLEADAESLTVIIEADDEATLDRMKQVVASHLDRFAFREAPLPFHWTVDGPPI